VIQKQYALNQETDSLSKSHNILNQHWEGTLASLNMQQTRKIEMWSAWRILWALICHIHVVVGKHQAAISSCMNNCGTKHRVMLLTSKLNSSDSQVWGVGIFLLPLQERVTPALFKNVMLLLSLQQLVKE
jgi:hypothetical protein